MTNDKMLKLVEALASLGYGIDLFKIIHVHERIITEYLFEFELILFPFFKIDCLSSKNEMVKLIESLASAGFGIAKFEFHILSSSVDLINLTLFLFPEEPKT
jgi:hypothetical protein